MSGRARIVPWLLFGSGFCALVYQTAWLREFRLVFGASTAASAAVVALFIAGLGLGGLLLGPRADRHASPLAFYAWLELGIALSSALTPGLLELVQRAYVALGGTPTLGLAGGTLLRLVLAALVLAVPTWLMGGTLPAAVRALTARDDAGRHAAALLYGVNTLGAVAGAFLSTFFMLELFGTRRTLWLACLLNVLVALVARRLALELPALADGETTREDGEDARDTAAAAAPPAAFVLSAAAVVGFAFFLMELVWYRLLGPLLGGSIFTFGLILAMALLGIGLGGAAYARLRRNRPATLTGFAHTCLAEAVCVALPFALGDRLAVLSLLLRPLGGVALFWGHVLAWSVVCAVVVLPAAFVAGYQFPMLIALLGRGRDAVGRQVGLAYAFNTAGAIAGSLAGGFGLIPLLSATGAWHATGLLLVALGAAALLLALRAREPRARLATPVVLGAVAVLLLSAGGPTAAWRHGGIGVGRAPASFPSPNALEEWLRFQRRIVQWQRDGVESSVALETIGPGYAFVINGKVDGNARGDAATMIMSGLLGALLHPAPQRSLVIGLGTGGTAGWLADVPGMQATDVIELEPLVLDVARDCAPINRAVLSNPRVHVTVGDAREVLLVSRERYDVIFSEPSNPYRAGIASLFTREYYQAVAGRLRPGGLFIQWVQAYDVDAPTVRTVYATLGSVFPAVETWQVGPRDLLLVATAEPLVHDVARLRARLQQEPYRAGMRHAWRVDSLEGFLAAFVARPELARALGAGARDALNTDDRNRVEFGFARTLGRTGLFTINDLRQVAALRDEHHPRTTGGEVDWARVDQERVVFYPFEHQAPRLRERFTPEEWRLAALWQHAENGDSARALALWRTLGREPRSPVELTLVASLLADLGEPAAGPYIERLHAQVALEGEALRARWLARQGLRAEAVGVLERLFEAYRRDPWPHPPLMERALDLALELAPERPEWTARLLAAVHEPFVLRAVEATRLRALRALLALRPPDALCRDTLRALEPDTPWTREWLTLRLACYAASDDPRTDEARGDLHRFLLVEPPALQPEMLPDS